MLKSLFVVLCEDSSVDVLDGQLSTFKIIDKVEIPIQDIDGDTEAFKSQLKEGVLIPLKLHCVTGWWLDKGTKLSGEVQILKTITNQSKEEIGQITSSMSIDDISDNRFNLREVINGLPLKGLGNYVFKIELKQNSKVLGAAEYPFKVKLES